MFRTNKTLHICNREREEEEKGSSGKTGLDKNNTSVENSSFFFLNKKPQIFMTAVEAVEPRLFFANNHVNACVSTVSVYLTERAEGDVGDQEKHEKL